MHGQAIVAHGLMLLNLLFPLITYGVLTAYWLRHRHSKNELLHLAVNQAWLAATLSTLLFIAANVLIVVMAQYKSTFALIVFEVYFVLVVPVFLIPGLLGLVNSNAGLAYHYPFISWWLR